MKEKVLEINKGGWGEGGGGGRERERLVQVMRNHNKHGLHVSSLHHLSAFVVWRWQKTPYHSSRLPALASRKPSKYGPVCVHSLDDNYEKVNLSSWMKWSPFPYFCNGFIYYDVIDRLSRDQNAAPMAVCEGR